MDRLEKFHEMKVIAERCVNQLTGQDNYKLILEKIVKVLEKLETEEITSLKDRIKELKTYFDELRLILASSKSSLEVELDLCRYADELLEKSEKEPVLQKAILNRLYKYSDGLLYVYDDKRLVKTNNPHEGVNNELKTEHRRISGKKKSPLWAEFHGAYDAIGLNFKSQEVDFMSFLEFVKKFRENLTDAEYLQYYNNLLKLREEHRNILKLRKEEPEVISKRIESILIPSYNTFYT